MKKLIGYIIVLVGLVGIAAYAIPQVREQIPLPAQVDDLTLLIASIIIAAVGVFFVMRGDGKSKKGREVPIFQGRDVIGYRRT